MIMAKLLHLSMLNARMTTLKNHGVGDTNGAANDTVHNDNVATVPTADNAAVWNKLCCSCYCC